MAPRQPPADGLASICQTTAVVVLAGSLVCEHDVEAPTQDLHDAVPSFWRELGVLDRCEKDLLRNRGPAPDNRVPG